MNLNRTIKNFFGKESPMSFPSKDQADALPKKQDGTPDVDFLPRETVRNVLLNCLANYPVKDRREVFMVNVAAQAIMGDEPTVELKDKVKKFLIDVVYTMTHQEDGKGNVSGIYYSWCTAPVLEELGVLNNED